MKNKAHEFAEMNQDEKSMHLFYTIENMIENLKEIGNELDPEAPNGCARLAQLSDLDDMICSLYDRVNKSFEANAAIA